MNKKLMLLAVAGLAILGGLIVSRMSGTVLTDAEIRQKFECDRLTKDARPTDYYCNNPDAYRRGAPVPK